jgi:hypothetical protein
MEDELQCTDLATPTCQTPSIFAFVAVSRGSHARRGHNDRGGRGGRGLSKKCGACGGHDHILLSCTTLDAALLKWTLAKRKMIVRKYGTPSGSASTHAALMRDV